MMLKFPNLRIPASAIAPSHDSSSLVSERRETEKTPTGTRTDSSLQDIALTLSPVAQDALQAQTKRFTDMQNALDKLQAMPSSKVSSKHAATERAEMLKKRLEMMKQMLLGATPAQAKAMAAQLKNIAKELAALGANLADTGNMATPMVDQASAPPTYAQNITAESQTAVAALETTVSAESSNTSDLKVTAQKEDTSGTTTPKKTEEPLSGRAQQVTAAYTHQEKTGGQKSGGNNGEEKSANAALKKSLQEANSALRALIAILKQRLGTANKDLKEAESLSANIEKLTGPTDIPTTDYTASAGISINISA